MGDERVGAETAEAEHGSVAPAFGAAAGRARPGPGGPAALRRLQRSAGNAAVSALLSREPDTKAPPAPAPAPDPNAPPGAAGAPPALMPAKSPPRKNYVFLMGDVKNDSFYAAARVFFKQHQPTAEFVTDKRTLAEIIQHVNAGGVPVLTLFIVSHANEAGNLGFSMDAADLKKDTTTGDGKPRTEFSEVKAANAAASLPTADVKIIDDFTKIEIKGCNIGRSQLMLDALDTAFGGHGEVIAPTHKQEYSFHGSKKKGVVSEEALYQYSVEDPGAPPDPKPAELEARFRAKYPAVPDAKWGAYMKKVKKKHEKRDVYTHHQVNPPADDATAVIAAVKKANLFPAGKGWVPTYKGRTIVSSSTGDEYNYKLHAERVLPSGSTEFHDAMLPVAVPPAKDALKAREIANSGRPGAYVWDVVEEVKGDTLFLRVTSERTEWTIDEKVVDAAGVAQPPETDPKFYGRSTAQPPPPPPPPTTP